MSDIPQPFVWLTFAVIFMGLAFLAGVWFTLWWTDPARAQEKSDKKFARDYDSNNWW